MIDIPAAVCGPGDRTGHPLDAPRVSVCRWRCPFCDPDGPMPEQAGNHIGQWASGERCMHCSGFGFTGDPGGFGEDELTEAPWPPAVMRRPCSDCAYRPGSPERGDGDGVGGVGGLPGPTEGPFYCHHGLLRVDTDTGTGYSSPAMCGARPVGAMVCAGWYAQALGDPLPAGAFHDPGGADRLRDAP